MKNTRNFAAGDLREQRVYANPWYMAGEDGGELDFLTARRVMLELLAEC